MNYRLNKARLALDEIEWWNQETEDLQRRSQEIKYEALVEIEQAEKAIALFTKRIAKIDDTKEDQMFNRINPRLEEQTERRLEVEARTNRLGTLYANCTPENSSETVRIEVSYQVFYGDPERAGYYIVHVRTPEGHPADAAVDYLFDHVHADDYYYFKVDDVYPY